MNNSVGYANPTRFANPVALGTDGIGADMLEEFRLAYVAGRASDVEVSPEAAWGWMENGWKLVPESGRGQGHMGHRPSSIHGFRRSAPEQARSALKSTARKCGPTAHQPGLTKLKFVQKQRSRLAGYSHD